MKNLNLPVRLILGIILLVPGQGLLRAQSIDAIRQKYPGEAAVVLNHSMVYTISISEGQPRVQSNETNQILYLSAEAGAYLSRYGFVHSSMSELQQYEAYTRMANDKKVKVSDFQTSDSKSDGVFYDDVKETSFDFPAIAPGAIGNLEVSILHKDPHFLSPFFFSHSLPVVKTELKISFPKDMSVKYKVLGDDSSQIAITQETRHGETTYTFSAKDLPAERAYADAPDSRWYASHVVFYIEKYQDESGRTVRWLGNPDDLYRLNHSYLQTINKQVSPGLKAIVDSLTTGAATQEARTRRIYNWVQQHIKYIAFEQGMEGFIPRDANLVCSRRFGDCKDMASILTVMLNTAGVPAWYTWIGTRELPYRYSETPTPIVDNHMICTTRLGDKYIFLDATDPDCVFGMPSEGIQDKQALVAMGDSNYKILTVPIPEKDRNILVDSTFLELTDQGLKGKISVDLSGYYSMEMHGRLSYTNENEMEEYMKNRLSRGSNKFRLDSFAVGDRGDKAHIRLTGSFTLQDYAKHLGDEWYLNLNLFKMYEHEEIDYPKRKMPIQFDFLCRKKYVIVLKMPPGYQPGDVPEGKSFHNDVWGFDLKYEKYANSIVLTQEFDNDHLLLQPAQFEAWNKVLEVLFPLYKESVSLVKK
jgi:hypothetical protein